MKESSTEYVCPVCGKKFDILGYTDYLYRRVFNKKMNVFCSWTCMHKAEQEHEARKKKTCCWW